MFEIRAVKKNKPVKRDGPVIQQVRPEGPMNAAVRCRCGMMADALHDHSERTSVC